MTTHTHSFLEPAATGSPISDRTQLSLWPASNRTFTLLICTWTTFFVACVKQSIYTAYMHMDSFLCGMYQTELLHCVRAHGQLSLWPVPSRTFTQPSVWSASNKTFTLLTCTWMAFFEACFKQNISTAFFVPVSNKTHVQLSLWPAASGTLTHLSLRPVPNRTFTQLSLRPTGTTEKIRN